MRWGLLVMLASCSGEKAQPSPEGSGAVSGEGDTGCAGDGPLDKACDGHDVYNDCDDEDPMV